MKQFFDFMRNTGIVIAVLINICALVWFTATLNATVSQNKLSIIRNAEASHDNEKRNNDQDVCIREIQTSIESLEKSQDAGFRSLEKLMRSFHGR